MANQHKNPLIGWHSDDPTLKPWIKAEAERRGMTEKALLDEALIEYRVLCELRAADPVTTGGNHTRKSAPKTPRNCTHPNFRGVKGVCPDCNQIVGYK